MPKALCVLKSDILTIDPLITTKNVIIKNPSIIFECNTHLLPRTVCENDSEYLQLIPYVTLVSKKTKEVFFYRKELKNTTGPLGQYSIGVAGHIQRYSNSLRATKDIIIGEITRILRINGQVVGSDSTPTGTITVTGPGTIGASVAGLNYKGGSGDTLFISGTVTDNQLLVEERYIASCFPGIPAF